MKIGIYSVTYLGLWYKGSAMSLREFLEFAKKEGWEGVELDTKRPHASPMDLGPKERKDLRKRARGLGLPISAISPNCDLSSPVPEQREAMLCYVRECIRLAHDLGSPLCKIFAAWRGVATVDGHGSYIFTKNDPYPEFTDNRRGLVVESLKELCKVADDNGVVLALQNHEPVVRNYRDVLSLISDVNSPCLKACMDIPIEGDNSANADWARMMVAETGKLQVHSHFGGEWRRDGGGRVELAWDPDADYPKYKIAYPEFVSALVRSGYRGFMNWEYCHPAAVEGRPAGIGHVHEQTRMALEYMKDLRSKAGEKRRD